MIDQLNAQFAIPDHIQFLSGPGEFPIAALQNGYGSAAVSVYGGHVLSYQPTGHEPVIWVSQLANYEAGSAIRGGIPIIFPWFGSHPADTSKPSHGFARRSMWQVTQTAQAASGETSITLVLTDTSATTALWPHQFKLSVTVTLGTRLEVSMRCDNLGDAAITMTNALHTYFAVADSTNITIKGLERIDYLDQLNDMQRKSSALPIQIAAEVDRIYLENSQQVDIVDPGLARTIHIRKQGSQSTVVWNPWIEKSARMGDFGDAEYLEMVCVEAGNVGDAAVTIAPNASHETRQIIWTE